LISGNLQTFTPTALVVFIRARHPSPLPRAAPVRLPAPDRFADAVPRVTVLSEEAALLTTLTAIGNVTINVGTLPAATRRPGCGLTAGPPFTLAVSPAEPVTRLAFPAAIEAFPVAARHPAGACGLASAALWVAALTTRITGIACAGVARLAWTVALAALALVAGFTLTRTVGRAVASVALLARRARLPDLARFFIAGLAIGLQLRVRYTLTGVADVLTAPLAVGAVTLALLG
jgi:hypothetical protein